MLVAGIKQYFVDCHEDRFKLDSLCSLYEHFAVAQVSCVLSRVLCAAMPCVVCCCASSCAGSVPCITSVLAVCLSLPVCWQCVVFVNSQNKCEQLQAMMAERDFSTSVHSAAVQLLLLSRLCLAGNTWRYGQ